MTQAYRSDHREVFSEMVERNGWTRGAELGLGSGLLSDRLLSAFPELYLIGVDHFQNCERADKVRMLEKQYAPRYRVLPMTTKAAAHSVEDRSLDFVFIDAGHGYKACRGDILRWAKKVKPGGFVGGHDYHENHPGVIKAVDEIYPERELFEGWIWGVKNALP